MFSSSSRKKNEGLSLVMDIQSGLVRGALVSFDSSLLKNNKPHLIYIVSRPIQFQVDINSERLLDLMQKAVEEIGQLMMHEGMERARASGYEKEQIDAVHYVMSSPWVMSQSKTVKMNFDKDTEITNSVVQDIVEREYTNNTQEKKDPDLTFIEQKIFDIRLNGYSIHDYKGKKAASLEVSFAVTTSSKHILEKIHESLDKNVRTKHVEHHSALLMQYMALRNLITISDEYIALHIHGELTDIVIVKKGISSYLASFPFGTVTLVRRISAAMNMSQESADSMISMYQTDKLEQGQKEKAFLALDPLLTEWQQQCLMSFGSLGEKTLLPKHVFLSAHSFYDLFSKNLSGTQFEILPLEQNLIDSSVVVEKSSERSTLMTMYVLALKTLSEQGVKNSSGTML